MNNKVKDNLVVAGYCRLSRDEDKENYSSIEEQKVIIKDYANSRGWDIENSQFYIDDNISGYTFNRPEFLRMMSNVKQEKIDIVIAKDLSRIGRNNGKVLVLIDEFKKMQKNLILVSEMCGTYDVLNDRDDTIGITTWFNERYVKDCSRKTRAQMYSKQKNGRLIMGNRYGYVKDLKDTTRLYVDEEIRPVIELIFKLYVEDGLGIKKICDVLNTKYNYPTPSVYYQNKFFERGKMYQHTVQKLWSTYMISNILSNDIYIGTLRTHKKETISIRGKAVKIPEEEHFIFKNHHEAIISTEIFELAQNIKKRKANLRSTAGTRKKIYMFSGLIRCGDCGYGVTGITINKKHKQKGYECSQYRTYGKSRCKYHEILESDIVIHLQQFLKFTQKKYENELRQIEIKEKDNRKNHYKEELMLQVKKLEAEYKILVNQKVKNLILTKNEEEKYIIENTYKDLEFDKINKIKNLKYQLKNYKSKALENNMLKIKTSMDFFEEIIKNNNINKYFLEKLIDVIWIYNDKTIQFDLKVEINKML